MNFGDAINEMKNGNKVARSGWNITYPRVPRIPRVQFKDNERCIVVDDIVFLKLNNGDVAICDYDDWVNKFNYQELWTSMGSGSAAFSDYSTGTRYDKYMHYEVMVGSRPSGYDIDHINRDHLDNRRINLRFATRSQNIWNSGPKLGAMYKGVRQYKDGVRYRALIQLEHQEWLGIFDTAEEAAIAYDIAALSRFGEFAYLNFPDKIDDYLKKIPPMMFVFLVPGSTFKVNRAPLLGIYPEGTEINYQPHIDMKTADGTIVPWLASQSDMLAEDWSIVP